MCIAIVKTKDAKITDEELKNCFSSNPDGAGLAYTKNNQLFIVKGIFELKQFIETVREVESIADNNILIHCRIGTSGKKDKLNCHPHVVNSSLVLIHNGIFDIDVPDNSIYSDTILFIYEYLKDLPKDFYKNVSILKLIEKAIGLNNKICFLNNKGEFFIVNEDEGEWRNGVWFSNSSYKSRIIYRGFGLEDNYIWGYEDYKNNEDSFYLSKNKIKKLRKFIRNVSDKTMLEIGTYPMYDIYNKRLVPYDDDNYNANQFIFLDELSEDLYEEWLYEYDTRFGTLKQAEGF